MNCKRVNYENLTFNAFRYEILMAVYVLVVHNKDFFTYCMMGLPEFKSLFQPIKL